MKQNIINLGLYVDDTQYHGAAFDKDTGEVIDFKCQPTLQGLACCSNRLGWLILRKLATPTKLVGGMGLWLLPQNVHPESQALLSICNMIKPAT